MGAAVRSISLIHRRTGLSPIPRARLSRTLRNIARQRTTYRDARNRMVEESRIMDKRIADLKHLTEDQYRAIDEYQRHMEEMRPVKMLVRSSLASKAMIPRNMSMNHLTVEGFEFRLAIDLSPEDAKKYRDSLEFQLMRDIEKKVRANLHKAFAEVTRG